MYGSSSYGNRTLQSSSRPKSKNRNTAGKNKKKWWKDFGFLHAVFQNLHSERFSLFLFHINPKAVVGLGIIY